MKRVLFLLVSALVAGTTYASNLSKDVIANVYKIREILHRQDKERDFSLEESSSFSVDNSADRKHNSADRKRNSAD